MPAGHFQWSALLVEAVNKPSLIMEASSAYCNYSIGQLEKIMLQKAEVALYNYLTIKGLAGSSPASPPDVTSRSVRMDDPLVGLGGFLFVGLSITTRTFCRSEIIKMRDSETLPTFMTVK